MNERTPHEHESQRNLTELDVLAKELGFIETEQMTQLRRRALAARTLEIATPLLLEYITLAEETANRPRDQINARVGLELARASLYFENQRFEELTDVYYDALKDADMIVNQSMTGELHRKVSTLLDRLYSAED